MPQMSILDILCILELKYFPFENTNKIRTHLQFKIN